MGRPLTQPDDVGQFLRMQEQIRQLRLARDRSRWQWHTLRPYLCGGWIDPFSNYPYRYDEIPDDEDPGDSAGFWDTGSALLFTGRVKWDPDGWWDDPPFNPSLEADPAYQGTPVVYLDSSSLIGPSTGLTGNWSVGGGLTGGTDPDDLGYPLPYAAGVRGYSLINGTQHSIAMAASSFAHHGDAMTEGYLLDMEPDLVFAGSGQTGGTRLDPVIRSPGGSGCPDPDGFTHFAAPAGTEWNLEGMWMSYDPDTPIVDLHDFGYPARTQDAYLFV